MASTDVSFIAKNVAIIGISMGFDGAIVITCAPSMNPELYAPLSLAANGLEYSFFRILPGSNPANSAE
jgi:Na+-transporting methylmalonyl-CoA/oxaloacetate decarboxylase beta subunit